MYDTVKHIEKAIKESGVQTKVRRDRLSFWPTAASALHQNNKQLSVI